MHSEEVFIYRQSRSCFHELGFCLLFKFSICLSLALLIYASITKKTPPHLGETCFYVICYKQIKIQTDKDGAQYWDM